MHDYSHVPTIPPKYMMALLDEKLDMYLNEIAMDLFGKLGVSVSLSTIHWSLQLLGYTRKRYDSFLTTGHLLILHA